METEPTEQLWTAADLGRWANISTGTVRNLRSAGKLPEPLKIAGSVRWVPSEVRAFFAAQRAAA